MSVQTIFNWCATQIARKPRPGYVTGPRRFGPDAYDCSGWTYMAFKADGKTIPADSSAVARWGRSNGQVRGVSQAQPGDLLVHDKYNDPYNSTGPRGHIGIFVRRAGNKVYCYESAGSGKGVGLYARDASFWNIAVPHPAYAGGTQPPQPPEEEVVDLAQEQRIIGTIQNSIKEQVALAMQDHNRVIATLQNNTKDEWLPQILKRLDAIDVKLRAEHAGEAGP